ncbi:MAG: CPBP family intramembrane metalloprotease [Anaerolineales bacterium]|jgi:membrane protease YdiL (CAAX protease family)
MKKLLTFNLKFDRDIAVITIVSTLLLIIERYNTFTTGVEVIDRVIIYLFVPLLIILFVFRDSPKEYGFRLGDWKAGLALTGLVILFGIPILYYTAVGDTNMQDYYDWQFRSGMALYSFLDLIGWEFFFRGWILFGYARKFGDDALWLQAVPFALAHLGKPEIETLSTIFGGFVFGLVSWRSKSFIYAFLCHWFVYSFTVMVVGGFFG